MTAEEILQSIHKEIQEHSSLLFKCSVYLDNIQKFIRPSEELTTGQCLVTTAGTPQQLVTGITPSRRVIVQALFNNTDNVVVGRQGVTVASGSGTSLTDKGRVLSKGQAQEFLVNDASILWVDAVVSGEGVTYVIEKDNN